MWRRSALKCAFAKMDTRIGEFAHTATKIRYIDISHVTAYAELVPGDLSSVGCALGLPRIAYYWDLRQAMFIPGASKILSIGFSAGTAYVDFTVEYTSSVGCGLGLPRVAYSQNGTSTRRCSPPGPPI